MGTERPVTSSSAEHQEPRSFNWALTIEYDGTAYAGYQRQRNQQTVQAVLESALERAIGEPVRLVGAGRTDAGVHAAGQVVSFRTGRLFPAERIIGGGNFYLPSDIAILDARPAPDRFSARRSALHRVYRYRILARQTRSPLLRRTAYHVPQPLDEQAMRQAAAHLVGRHDFAGFSGRLNRPTSTVRSVRAAWIDRDGELVDFWIRADSFLPHQVRIITGTLIDIGRARLETNRIRRVLETRDRSLAGPTAPAHGLCLMHVEYPEEEG